MIRGCPPPPTARQKGLGADGLLPRLQEPKAGTSGQAGHPDTTDCPFILTFLCSQLRENQAISGHSPFILRDYLRFLREHKLNSRFRRFSHN